jgi:hypothetical protein
MMSAGHEVPVWFRPTLPGSEMGKHHGLTLQVTTRYRLPRSSRQTGATLFGSWHPRTAALHPFHRSFTERGLQETVHMPDRTNPRRGLDAPCRAAEQLSDTHGAMAINGP